MSALRDLVLIIKDITQISTDLIRCQIDQLAAVYKDILTRTLSLLLLQLTAIILALGGVALMVSSIHTWLMLLIGPLAAGILLGTILILLGLVLFLVVRGKLHE